METTVVEKEEKLVVSVDEYSELNASVEDTIERAADVSSLEVRNDDSSSLDLEASAETTLDSFKTETSDEDNEESGPDERKVDACEKTAVYSDVMRPVKVKAHVVNRLKLLSTYIAVRTCPKYQLLRIFHFFL